MLTALPLQLLILQLSLVQQCRFRKAHKVTAINQSSIQALIDHLQSSQSKVNMIRTAPEASGSGASGEHWNPFFVLAANEPPDERILLSLCDGAGCVGFAAANCGTKFDRYIAVEKDDMATVICNNVNGGKGDIPEPDHYWHSDVMEITREDVAQLG